MKLRSYCARITCHKLFISEFYLFFKFNLVFKTKRYIFDSCLDLNPMVIHAIEIDYGYYQAGEWVSIKVLSNEYLKEHIKKLTK